MSLRLWPNNYENKDYISKEEKRLLRNASRNFTDGHFAVGIDPMGMNKPDYKMGLYISPNEGFVAQLKIFEKLLKDNDYDLEKINFEKIKWP